MSILGKFTKQPVEVQDYDIDFTEYLASQNDAAISHSATADTGITIMASALTAGVVKVFVSGGTDGESYKVSATITTSGGRVKQGDILVRVKEF
jgi:hypothetical protein